jgi:phage repressor protein C with HTH and peptisase S24 domain
VGWASGHIERLKRGERVSFRPRGNSMAPRIKSGDLCTVDPADHATLESGDIVLCRVRGAEYLHFVKAIQGERFQIGNNRGGINGWIGANGIFGKLVKVEP